MRIRKRAVPLPFSLLSPVPFSDPHLRLVQLSRPSDLPAPPSDVDDPRRLIRHDYLPAAASAAPPRSVGPLARAFKDEKTNKEQREESNNTSKQSDLGAVADDKGVELLLPLSNQTRVGGEGRWCDGDKAIPLKKRKASLEMNGMVVAGERSKMKSRTNKKIDIDVDYEEGDLEEEDEEEEDDDDNDNRRRRRRRKKRKKKAGGSELMEGSRCSRVNGRGWRCMQPTLVGYSLCEHHLGKGRLRSMSTVSINLPSSQSAAAAGNARKRTRIGMVKARSLSSLLCLPNNISDPSNPIMNE